MLDIDEEPEMDCDEKMDGSSDSSGRGCRSERKQYNQPELEWSPV